MGMFDEVTAFCTKEGCDGIVEWQSKAGVCELKTYSFAGVPPEVAVDIDGDTECCKKCDKPHTIRLHGTVPKFVPMVVE